MMQEREDQAQVDAKVATGQVKVLPDSRDTRAITQEQKPEVRRRYDSGQSVNEIAKRLAVTPSQVRRWLGLPPVKPKKPERRRHRPKHGRRRR